MSLSLKSAAELWPRKKVNAIVIMLPVRQMSVVLLFAQIYFGITQDGDRMIQDTVFKHLKKHKKKDGAVRLINGRNQHEGNVRIFHNGSWGNVCDDEWDAMDAAVVCRELGYKHVRKVTHGSFFGATSDRYWMDNLYCTGDEKHLSQCHFEGWGLNDCDSSEAAGVICEPRPNSTTKLTAPPPMIRRPIYEIAKSGLRIRLMGGRSSEEGRVEVKYDGADWGVVCGDGWSLLEAMVVCRTLGLGYAAHAAQTHFFGGHSSNIVLNGVRCRGNESNFALCTIASSDSRECLGNRNFIAGIVCTKNLPDLIIDLRELEKSSYIEDKQLYFLQCAMEENCLASSAYRIQRERRQMWRLQTRRLLRFTAKITNIGTTDFRPFIPKHMWEFHQCHMHYHSMEIFASFDVLDRGGTKVAEGHKASFCLEDNQCTHGVRPRFACADFGDQGISVNCSDIYKHSIDCQWVDITELNPGIYTFQVIVNPEFKVAEMTFRNNMATCSMYYTETYVRIHSCHWQHP